ncbi:MAG: hypothetical protein M1838_000675 [Thelocarpon superellum]|nr:MAG: hypothetical protein M1838_000675 [Thelocarpon superellum]
MFSTRAFASLVAALFASHAAVLAAGSDAHPAAFEPTFDPSTFCPAGQTTVTAPAALVLYPANPKAIYNIVGDFYNISWIGPKINATNGTDNQPGATRWMEGDPFVQEEQLIWYALNTTSYAHQQVARTATAVTIAPGYVEEASHLTVAIVPRCDGQAAQFGFTVTFCMSGTAPADLDLPNVIFTGAKGALQKLWTLLDIQTPFNSTSTCDQILQPQS